MATIIFYEKPGCRNQARQKEALRAAGHELDVRDLLSTPWRGEMLRPFFQDMAVTEWFNPAAPRIKSGAIDPAALTAEEAIETMLIDPLLIRRPLLVFKGMAMCKMEKIHQILWISNALEEYPMPLSTGWDTCARTESCPTDDRGHGSDLSGDTSPESVTA